LIVEPMKFRLPPKVSFIIDSLEGRGYEAYAVGGCVRDMVLALEPKDYDITTNALPEQIKEVFRHTVDTGIQHGTVTVIVGGEGFEVTTYRIDGPYSDARHPSSVIFSRNLKEDLRRRDFTINAMAYNHRTGLVDIFGGMDDLQKKVIRCVGNAGERFGEDALRVMRAARFAARFGFSIEPETRDAMRDHAGSLSLISAERIREELLGLISSDNPGMFRILFELGITAVVLPEFDKCMATPQNTRYHCYSVGEHIIKSMECIKKDAVLRMTMLLHDIAKPEVRRTGEDGRDHFKGHASKGAEMADEIMRRLRFDNDTRKKCARLIFYHDLRPAVEGKDIRRAVNRIGEDLFEDYLEVQRADLMAKNPDFISEDMKRIDAMESKYREILRMGDCVSLRSLAVNGRDLIGAGVSQGKYVGELLNDCLELVLEFPEKNDRCTLIAYALEKYGNIDIS
jgi:tRNA nucleotidyltransferase (CCA-adding enzyme)